MNETLSHSGEAPWVSACLERTGGDLRFDPRFCVQPITKRDETKVSEAERTNLLTLLSLKLVLTGDNWHRFCFYLKELPTDLCVQIWFMYLGEFGGRKTFASYLDIMYTDTNGEINDDLVSMYNGTHSYEKVLSLCCEIRRDFTGGVINIILTTCTIFTKNK